MKTISLTDEACERLKSWKTVAGESFSKVVPKTVPKRGTAGELDAAFDSHDTASVRTFLESFPVFGPDEDVLHAYANLFADLRRRNAVIGPHDLWIAAAALVARVTLVTRNTDGAGRVPGLRLERY